MQRSLISRRVVLNNKFVACGDERVLSRWELDTSKVAAALGNKAPYWSAQSEITSGAMWTPAAEQMATANCEEWTDKHGSDQFSTTLQISFSTQHGSALRSEGPAPPQLGTTAVMTAKIRIHPTAKQAQLFTKCAGTHRYFWNKAKHFVDTEYERAKDERISKLEEGVDMGCAHVTPEKVCGKATKGHVCKAHGHVHGPCTEGGKVACVVKTAPPRRCGIDVLDGGAAVGWSDRYFCEEHAGKGLGVKATHGGHSIWSAITIRDAVLQSDNDLGPELAWQKDIPYDTRQGAIRKFAGTMASFFERRKAHPETNPPGFLKKSSRGDSIFTANVKAMKFKNGRLALFASRVKGNIRVAHKDKKRLTKHLAVGEASNIEIARDVNRKWYIILPRKVKVQAASPRYGDVALDPGGRSFQAFYSPEGLCGKIGDGLYMEASVKGRLLKADSLMSLAAKLKNEHAQGRKRRAILRRAQALRTKVHDVVRDLHRKTCRFLCDNFRAVFVPPFKAPEMTRIGDRVIGCKAVRNLMTFAHSEFRNKLIEYGARRGTRVYVVSEAWTTKTCTGCGHVMDVGSSKTVACEKCGLRLDRDHSGARNIFMRSYQALKA